MDEKVNENNSLQEAIVSLVASISGINEYATDENKEALFQALYEAMAQSASGIVAIMVHLYRSQKLSRDEAQVCNASVMDMMRNEIQAKNFEGIEKEYSEVMESIFSGLLDQSIIQAYGDVLYFQLLNKRATVPTFAHDTDACADLYCPEDVVVPANARGFKVPLGLACAIPDGWCVQFYNRSGMAMNTPIRLSNAVPIIDSGYLGQWCLLFDNLSNEDYKISAGDRIAQCALKPVYHFSSTVVKDIHSIKQTDRDEGGFGSSGK